MIKLLTFPARGIIKKLVPEDLDRLRTRPCVWYPFSEMKSVRCGVNYLYRLIMRNCAYLLDRPVGRGRLVGFPFGCVLKITRIYIVTLAQCTENTVWTKLIRH